MLAFLIRRLVYGALTIWAISVVTFMIFFMIPTGDPAVRIAGKSPTPELIAAITKKYHFDKPLPVQYFYTMKSLVTGQIKSFNIDAKVVPMVLHALPVTLSLVAFAATMWLIIGVAIGIKGARSEGSWMDRALTIGALVGLSFPTIWLAMVLIYVFTVKIPIFPPGDYVTIYRGGFLGWIYHLILPAMTLVIVSAASYALISRTNIRSSMNEEWVKTATAKGINPERVFIHHIFRLAMIPVVIMFGMDLAFTLGGAIFTETIFGLPGIGSVLMLGIRNLDFPILLTMTLFGAALIVFFNIIVDIVQAIIDPRVRLA
jgi:peptide/nickel transport system permease protein